MNVIADDTALEAAALELIAVEPRFGDVVAAHGLPSLRRAPGGLPGLLRIVVDQMISLKAGEAIWARVENEIVPFSARAILRLDESKPSSVGLSRAKVRCFRGVAAAVDSGSLDFAALDRLPDGQAFAVLTSLPGIGPWTANIYLLSAMGRSDAWPEADLALQAAAQHLFGLARRPDARRLSRLAEPWRPWRSVAARLLWSHYRGLKGLAQAVS